MTRQIVGICLLIGMLTAFTSCRDNGDDMLDSNKYPNPYTMTGQFEAIWLGINQNYVFWEIDPVNWDDVYAEYHPRFEELDKREAVKTADLQLLYEEILGELIDNHMKVTLRNQNPSEEDITQIVTVRPAVVKMKKYGTQDNGISLQLLQASRDKMKETGRITHDVEYVNDDPNASLRHMLTYVIDEDILYLRPSDFFVIASLANADAYRAYDSYLRQLLFNNQVRSVIIDLRNNGGGMLWDMFTILGPLLKEPCHVLDTKTKMGTGRLDYGEWTPFIVDVMTKRKIADMMKWEEELPETASIGDRPLVVLVNHHSASMSEMTAIGAKNLSYATVIGEQTYGATGPLSSDTHLSFSGQFGDSKLQIVPYSVITSTWMSRTSEGKFVEGEGVTPDAIVPLDYEKLVSQQIDNQLEYSINFLHGKTNGKGNK